MPDSPHEFFFKKLLKEQSWTSIGIAVLFVLGAICVLGKITFINPSFSLPQIELGIGLLVIAMLFTFILFLIHKVGVANASQQATLRHPTLGIIDTDDKIRKTVRIRVSANGEGMSIWKFGAAGQVRAHLGIVNFAPFPIEIDRIVGDVLVRNSTVGRIQHLKRNKIEACAYSIIYVETDLSTEQIEKIKFQLSSITTGEVAAAGFQITAYIEAQGRRFELTHEIVTGNVIYRNFHLPS